MATFDKIKDMIVDQLDVEADEVTMDANIQEDLGADSLDIVDLIMAVEDEFEVKIDDDASENNLSHIVVTVIYCSRCDQRI